MNHQRLIEIEHQFRTLQRQDLQLRPFQLLNASTNELLDIIACRPANNIGNYFRNTKEKKEKIVLHHTAGHLQGDLHSLTRGRHPVSTAFVIARDGTIYQLFHSNKWSYHLGKGAIGINEIQSKQSIGIELSNYGYLIQRGNKLETIYSRTKNKKGEEVIDEYCDIIDTHLYQKLEASFRGQFYYATFTEAQYNSLATLIRYICNEYDIPNTFLPPNLRFGITQEAANFRGILSHVNFIARGKWDLGPVFDYELLEKKRVDTTHSSESLTLEQLQENYGKKELEFQKFQVMMWGTNSENPSDVIKLKELEKELEKAYKLVQQYATTGMVETQTISNFVSEDEIDIEMPLSSSRSIFNPYGPDGPEEIPYDYLADF